MQWYSVLLNQKESIIARNLEEARLGLQSSEHKDAAQLNDEEPTEYNMDSSGMSNNSDIMISIIQ